MFDAANKELVDYLRGDLLKQALPTPLGAYLLFVLSMAGDRQAAARVYGMLEGILSKDRSREETLAQKAGRLVSDAATGIPGSPGEGWVRKAVEGLACTFDVAKLFPDGRVGGDYSRATGNGLTAETSVYNLFFQDGMRQFRNALAAVPLMYGVAADYPGKESAERTAAELASAAGGNAADYSARILQYAFLKDGTAVPPSVPAESVEAACSAISSAGDKSAVAHALAGSCGPWQSPGDLPNCPPWRSLVETVPAVDAALESAGRDAGAGAGPVETEPEAVPAEDSPTAGTAGDGGPRRVSGTGASPLDPETDRADTPPVQASPAVDPSTIGTLDYRTAELLEHMAYDEDQLKEAVDSIEYLDGSTFPFLPYLTSYHPGMTETAVAKLLDNYTARASHRNFTLSRGEKADRKTVMIPPAFKVDAAPSIWTRAVISGMGFPFINFTCPSVAELLRGTDPAKVRRAYRNVKAMFKQCGLKKPVDTLKEFARAQYRNCALNALTVEANELYAADPGTTVTASVVDPYSKVSRTKGSIPMSMDFLTMFYSVLSPVTAIRQYSEVCGLEPKDYMAYLSHYGKPPVYILNPKRVQFRRGPRGGLFHRLFSSKTAPVLVRARVNGHDGGLLVPEKVADLIFCE